MAASVVLPPEIRIIESLEVVRYCLPRRRAPQARLLGAVGVAVFGLPLVWGVTIWMARSCNGGGAAVLVAIGLLITSSMLVNVLFHFMGRAEVELGSGELRAIERVIQASQAHGPDAEEFSADFVMRDIRDDDDRAGCLNRLHLTSSN